MNNILNINSDVLIQNIIIYLNTHEITKLKSLSKYYFKLIEENKRFIYNNLLNNNSKIIFNCGECNYSFYYVDIINKHKYAFSICKDFPLEECVNRFNIMLRYHNYNITV